MNLNHLLAASVRVLLIGATSLSAILVYHPTASADRFYLSEDRLIEGILIHEDSKSVSFELDGAGVWTLSRKALHRVERESPGVYWMRVGDRHQDRDRIEQAKNAFEEAAKDPSTRNQAVNRLQELEAPVVEERLVKAIEEDDHLTQEVAKVQAAPQPAPAPQQATLRPIQEEEVAQPRRPQEKWISHVREYSDEQGVDPLLVQAIIQVESRGNPKATSKSGAKGLMQLMPRTASALGVKDPYNPEQNIRGGVKYLGYLMKQFSNVAWPDRMGHVVAAYNQGPNRIKDAGDYRRIPAATRYADKVLAAYEDLKEDLSGEVAFANENPRY